jgi:hypothetical protein
MNIIKIQNQLKGVPDDTLVGYVQNPSGQVPTYLALSELQRRKEMRNSYQANKPEEKTVAEDLVQEAQPQPQMEGVAGLPQAQPMMQAMAPQPEMPMQQMAQGGLAELDTGTMYDENNYANGGIVAFAKGGTPDEYGVTMPIVPRMDDLIMQTEEAQKAFGVDPDFYKKTLEESKAERLKELSEAKNMDQAQLLLSMGSAFAGTPTFGKALSVAGERAVPIIGAMGKNQREINSMYKMADRKSLEAQYAQARGDAAGAQKAISEKESLLLNAQLKEADIRKDISVAEAKARAAASGKTGDLNSKVYDKALRDFSSSFPNGAQETVFQNNPGFFQYVKNIYLQNAQDYIKNDKMPVVPSETQLLDMFKKGVKTPAVATKPAANTKSDTYQPPKKVQSIMDKVSSDYNSYKQDIINRNSPKRTKNTPEELLLTDPKYDNLDPEDNN